MGAMVELNWPWVVMRASGILVLQATSSGGEK